MPLRRVSAPYSPASHLSWADLEERIRDLDPELHADLTRDLCRLVEAQDRIHAQPAALIAVLERLRRSLS